MIEDYYYQLPENLIASEPAKPRDSSRLLVFYSQERKIVHDRFYHLNKYLRPKDLLVLNNSKVFPARLLGRKPTGGKIELLMIKEREDNRWLALIGGKVAVAEKIFFDCGLEAQVIERSGKEALVEFNLAGDKLFQAINIVGRTPIPPYIKKTQLSENQLRREYQTVYATEFGSAAAPTAGLHFSKRQLKSLHLQGIEIGYLNLRVGLGTFAPLSQRNLREKKLHSEDFTIPYQTLKKIFQAKKSASRVIAVGTTVVRALESISNVAQLAKSKSTKNIVGSTEIFIQPGFQFKIIDSLITNFHLPASSLMMLVAAFLQFKGINDGRKQLLEIYRQAIEKKYRFYSFGDAMLIL